MVMEHPNKLSNNWGIYMQFVRLETLVNSTPTEALCATWGLSPEDVDARKSERTPLTIREAGSLAELHGLGLEDVLSL